VPLVGAPLVLEAAFQAAGLHHMAVAGRLGLPAAVGSVHLLGEPDDRLSYELLVQQAGDAWDIDVDGPGGPILRVRGYRMADAGPLPPGQRFPVPEGGWPVAMVARVTRAGGPGGAPMMALHPDEEALVTARGTARRQDDRRLGRAAARAALHALLGHGDFAVLAAPSGAPEVRGAAAQVSVCHAGGVGFAAAARDGHLGLDAERPALRPPSFAATWFTATERVWSAGHPIAEAQLWTAKEAVMKALGLGMRLHPREIEVGPVTGHRVSVVLHGDAAAAWAALGGGALRVTTGWSGGFVVAAARIAPTTARAAATARRRAG
jgi:4'-phosphopantetheinyl transferase